MPGFFDHQAEKRHGLLAVPGPGVAIEDEVLDLEVGFWRISPVDRRRATVEAAITC